MAEYANYRASGLSAGEESAKEEAKILFDLPIDKGEMPLEDPIHDRKWRTPGFQRMRFDWDDEADIQVTAALRKLDEDLKEDFPEVFELLDSIRDLIREKVVDPATGEIMLGEDGKPLWLKTSTGHYVEDYTKLTLRVRENLLFKITFLLPKWDQLSQNIWLESMFARVAWEERYAIAYNGPYGKTMGEREAAGKRDAIDERYFAVILAAYSRKSASLVYEVRQIASRLENGVKM